MELIMVLIRCTEKLRKEMGLKKSAFCEAGEGESLLGAWHANLLYIDRRKCVLFANDKTLLNFIALDVSRDQIRELKNVFFEHLLCVLSWEGVPEAVKNRIVEECREVRYAASNSRSVLGSMNDLAACYKHHIILAGGIARIDPAKLTCDLNDMPMSAIKCKGGSQALKALYENAI